MLTTGGNGKVPVHINTAHVSVHVPGHNCHTQYNTEWSRQCFHWYSRKSPQLNTDLRSCQPKGSGDRTWPHSDCRTSSAWSESVCEWYKCDRSCWSRACDVPTDPVSPASIIIGAIINTISQVMPEPHWQRTSGTLYFMHFKRPISYRFLGIQKQSFETTFRYVYLLCISKFSTLRMLSLIHIWRCRRRG